MQVTKYHILDDHGKTVVDYFLPKNTREFYHRQKRKTALVLYINSYSFPVSAGMSSFVENEAPEQILVS